jgi:hypothetical protein
VSSLLAFVALIAYIGSRYLIVNFTSYFSLAYLPKSDFIKAAISYTNINYWAAYNVFYVSTLVLDFIFNTIKFSHFLSLFRN